MNPIWAFFFKDRFRNPFSMFKMSLAELIVLLSMFGACGYGIWKGVNWLLAAEGVTETQSAVIEESVALPASLWPPRIANPPYYYGVDK